MAQPIYDRLLPTLDYNFNIHSYNSKLDKYETISNGNHFGCNKSIGSLVKCAFLCFLLFIVLTDASQNSIHVDNNSYKDIVISFDPAISTNLVSTLLENVEEKIQQVSDHLFTATNQSLCFGEVILLLPDHWSSKIGNRRLNTTRSFTPLDTDIYINSNGEMFNEEPFTQQYGQCGVGGKLIHVSKEVFLKKDNGNVDVKTILHQWAAYRYGVFSEHGFRNDKFHPDYTVDTSERLIMTSCASNVEGETMDIIVSPVSPSADCFSRPLSDSFPPTNSCSLSTAPSTIVSSLMFSPRLSSVSTFCSEDNHDAFSPTKQNRLCDGKSINEVIRSHPDFRGLQSNANKCNTKFTLVTEKRPRIGVFVDFILDHDDSMIMHPILTFFKPYNPLILQLQPHEAGVLTADDFTHGHPEDVPVCFDCAMEHIRGNVKNVENSITHLYLVTAGHYRTDRFPLESYAKELLSYDIKVKVVIYPYRPEANYSTLLRFAQAASAELFVIPHIDAKRPGSTYNRIAFLETLVLAQDNLHPSELVVLAKNTTSETTDYSFKFNVDQSLIEANYSIKVLLLCHTEDSCTDRRIAHKVFINDVPVKVKGQRLASYSNTYTFNAHPERGQDGVWEVKWTGLDDTKVSYITAIAVTPDSAKVPSLESNFFTGSCWLSHKQPIISPTSRDRVYAYVSLTKKLHEYVHNASVAIAFYDEVGALVSMAPMVDDGLGDPDITRGDGVWSYLLSDLPVKRFIRAEAIITSERFTLYPGLMDRPCCGSAVPEQPVVQGYKDLNRVLSCGSFYIDDASSTDMFVRSSRTFDLSVSLVDETRYIVKVDFTLPTGAHSIEDIKIFNWTERPFIRSSFDSYGVRLFSVFEQGLNKYSKEFEIPKGTVSISGPYVIAAQLKDPTGAKSLSNLVNIYLNGEPDLPSEPPESIMQSSDSDSSDFFDIINSAGPGRSFFSGSDGSGILGIWHVTFIVVGSFLFILVILLFIICLVAGRKRRGTDSGRHSNGSNGSINVKEEAKKKIPPGSMGTENPDKSVYRSYSDGLMGVKGDDISDIGHHHIHSHHITSNHLTHQTSHLQHQQLQQVPPSQQQQLNQPTYQNSSVNLDNGIKGISPVDSIPANKLLSHYDKVKQAKQRNEPLPVMRIEDITDIGSVHNASSLSDNDSRFRGSVTGLPDDPFVTMSNDLNSWRYPVPVDQYQYYNPHANYVPQNTNHLPNSVIEWRNSYDGSETISDYDPRYGTVDKQTTAVSQV
ncbi:uncharacterized protein LOC107369632 isoform X1 [Tetranychus urticae]|uniref:uncharacterized protein LOC107369632 isoform X1 n=1 Tax=Tetranychus urticae TaxID=32264 RepID=UPI00077BAA2A|nr:uncharacterized protein LOC107369632 isoform X1 [Tetranychus urticae]